MGWKWEGSIEMGQKEEGWNEIDWEGLNWNLIDLLNCWRLLNWPNKMNLNWIVEFVWIELNLLKCLIDPNEFEWLYLNLNWI